MPKKEKAVAVITQEAIKSKIYTVRGIQVMLDRDLAALYEVETRVLNQAVRRNIKRFHKSFLLQLTREEILNLSQFVISSKIKHSPNMFAFSEHGVVMLASILKSEKAIQINIQIVNVFVEMRRFLITNAQVFQRLDNVERKQIEYKMDADKKFEKVFEALESNEIQPKQGIFFDGQIFDAFKFVLGLMRKAKKSLVLIDNYIDETVLDERRKEVDATIITRDVTEKLQLLLEKHNKQYSPINIKQSAIFHDRFLIIDEKEMYHIGASIKDLGKKCFAFSKIEDSLMIERVVGKIW